MSHREWKIDKIRFSVFEEKCEPRLAVAADESSPQISPPSETASGNMCEAPLSDPSPFYVNHQHEIAQLIFPNFSISSFLQFTQRRASAC